ncbi:uncharacterized protein [Argopecten irradians]|uniref:uncharacterized protein n=1 Tax=Argopecten irradians TaxID=31199 RepID=UPI0037205465
MASNTGLVAVHTPGQTTCVHHRQVTLDWYCETDGDIICAKCVSSTHKGNNCIQLSETIPQHKQKIQDFVKHIERNKVIHIEKEIDCARESLRKQTSHFESVSKEVQKQGEKLKEEIDILTAQHLSRLKHLEEENTKLLKSYQNELEEKLEELRTLMKECKESLQTGTDIQVFDIASQLLYKFTIPRFLNLGTVKFNPKANPRHLLESAFGNLASNSLGFEPSPPVGRMLDTVHMTQMSDLVGRTTLLPTTILLTEKNVPCSVRSICPANDDGIWACDNSTYSVNVSDQPRRCKASGRNPGYC